MKRKRIILEPQLEALAKDWNALERLEAAIMFRRWAHELEVSAFMMVKSGDDDEEGRSSPSAQLRRLRRALSKPGVPVS